MEEKIKFLEGHYHDLLNQRAALDARLKEAKGNGREVVAQHISAEVRRTVMLFFLGVVVEYDIKENIRGMSGVCVSVVSSPIRSRVTSVVWWFRVSMRSFLFLRSI